MSGQELLTALSRALHRNKKADVYIASEGLRRVPEALNDHDPEDAVLKVNVAGTFIYVCVTKGKP